LLKRSRPDARVENYGIAGMVRTGAWLDYTAGLEVLTMGRSATGKEECATELAGSQLLVRLSLQGGWVWVTACGLDEDGAPEFICNFPDTPKGWAAVRKFVRALEISGIRALHPRPIRIGESGRNAYVIDY
jgi:hypothetical protein